MFSKTPYTTKLTTTKPRPIESVTTVTTRSITQQAGGSHFPQKPQPPQNLTAYQAAIWEKLRVNDELLTGGQLYVPVLKPESTNLVKSKTYTPKEAATKLLDSAMKSARDKIGESLKLIEPQIRAYAFPKFEKAFTYLAKDGVVSQETVDSASKYALLVLLLLIAAFVYETIKSKKEEIKKIEKEIEELNSSFSKDMALHNSVRQELNMLSKKLLECKTEIDKYEGIIAKIDEAKAGLQQFSTEQTFFSVVKKQIVNFFVDPKVSEKEEIKSFLKFQDNDDAKQTVREIEKSTSVDSVIIAAEDKIERLDRKRKEVQSKMEVLEESSVSVEKHVEKTVNAYNQKIEALKNNHWAKFFAKSEENNNEIESKESKFEC